MSLDLDLADLADLEQDCAAAQTTEAVEAVLQKIYKVTPRLRDPANFGRKLFTPGLDALIPLLAARLQLTDVTQTKSNDRVCIVATRFYDTGGHTRVAQDIMAGLGPDRRATMIFTDLRGEIRYRVLFASRRLRSHLGEHACLILSAGSLTERIVELYMMLRAARPTRIMLMCHPFDPVAVIACWPFRDVVEFIHHVDHIPGFGASAPWSAHVDVTYACHLACRSYGLPAVYAGMTSPKTDAPARAPTPGRLRFATCGDQHKFRGPGERAWTDYAAAILATPGAELFHIGPASDDFQQEVHGALSAAGIDPARYVFAGIKPSLPAALAELEIDIYFSSYPAGGGKAILEAMVAGVPVIIPADAGVPPLMQFDLPLKHYVKLSSPDEVSAAVAMALDLAREMRTPLELENRDREIGRFAAFVAGQPPAD